MKIGFVSDLHLEFIKPEFHSKIISKIIDAPVDVIVMAGDIDPRPRVRSDLVQMVSEYKPVFHVLGNHDYYHGSWFDDFNEDIGMVGGCLWTDFDNNPLVQAAASKSINDFKLIKDFSIQKAKEIHEDHKKRIFESPSEIVVTHFPPTHHGTSHPRFKGDTLNAYFSVDLEMEIMESNKKLWICGHTHYHFDLYVGNCRVVSNPFGYPGENYSRIEDYNVAVIEV